MAQQAQGSLSSVAARRGACFTRAAAAAAAPVPRRLVAVRCSNQGGTALAAAPPVCFVALKCEGQLMPEIRALNLQASQAAAPRRGGSCCLERQPWRQARRRATPRPLPSSCRASRRSASSHMGLRAVCCLLSARSQHAWAPAWAPLADQPCGPGNPSLPLRRALCCTLLCRT